MRTSYDQGYSSIRGPQMTRAMRRTAACILRRNRSGEYGAWTTYSRAIDFAERAGLKQTANLLRNQFSEFVYLRNMAGMDA